MLIASKQADLGNVEAVGQASNGAYIGEDQAKSIALDHAGITADTVSFVHVKLDYDDGQMVYEIEFYSNNMEYDYEINATTEDIVEYDTDDEYYSDGQTQSGNDATNNHQGTTRVSGQYIGENNAKTAALSHAGVSANAVRQFDCELDSDNGRAVYEIDFLYNSKEYEYEIDAYTGDILHWESERD